MAIRVAEHIGAGQRQRSLIVMALAFVLVLLASGPAEAASAKVIHSGPPGSRGVALTFDDGWSVGTCASIANTLRRERVVGTFFINGAHLTRNPGKWRRIIGKMPIANHTVGHRNLKVESASSIRNQILANERVHQRVLRRPLLKVLRPPYGSRDQQVVRIAGSLGYRHVLIWSLDSFDAKLGATVSSIIRNATGGGHGTVVLMHCNRSMSAKALPAIIRHYKARGIPIVGLGKMLGIKAQPRKPASPGRAGLEAARDYLRR